MIFFYFKKQFYVLSFHNNFSTTFLRKTTKKTFINLLLKSGKKQKVEKKFLLMLKETQKCTKKNSLNIFKSLIVQNYTIFSLKKLKNQKFKRKNAKQTMIPFILKKQNRIKLSLKTIIFLSKKILKKSFFFSLKSKLVELVELKNNIKEELFKLIFLKKNFAHYRWFI